MGLWIRLQFVVMKIFTDTLIDALFSSCALLVMRKVLYSQKCGVQILNIFIMQFRYLIRSLSQSVPILPICVQPQKILIQKYTTWRIRIWWNPKSVNINYEILAIWIQQSNCFWDAYMEKQVVSRCIFEKNRWLDSYCRNFWVTVHWFRNCSIYIFQPDKQNYEYRPQ